MNQKVLIGYESATGTTEEVCQSLKAVLQSHGHDVDLMRISEIKALSDYDKVVLASPINGMNWLQGPKEFLIKERKTLKQKEVVLVYVSYILKNGNGFWLRMMAKGMKKIGDPIGVTTIKGFGGKVEKVFGAVPRMIFGISKTAAPDARNMKEVTGFGETLNKRWS